MWGERQTDIQSHKCTPSGKYMLSYTDLLETFQHNNSLLEEIQKCLEAYLESKRVIFPRYTHACFVTYYNRLLHHFYYP